MISDSNDVDQPFQGFVDQTMVLQASPTVGTIYSSTLYKLIFDSPTQFKLEQASSSQLIGSIDSSFVFNCGARVFSKRNRR